MAILSIASAQSRLRTYRRTKCLEHMDKKHGLTALLRFALKDVSVLSAGCFIIHLSGTFKIAQKRICRRGTLGYCE